MKAIEIRDLAHTYDGKRFILKDINLEIEAAEIAVMVGPSGVGKSTLLRCINRLTQPTRGSVKVFGEEVVSASRIQLRQIRRKIGVIFQQFNLFERQTVIDNVLLGRLGYLDSWRSLLYFPKLVYKDTDYELAKQALKEVDLEEFACQRVINLSGGQKQRVAIARALVQQPKIILADEPVSNLDPYLARDIMFLLTSIAKKKRLTIFASLHSIELAQSYAGRIIGIAQGKIIYDGNPKEINEKTIRKIYERKS